MKVRRVDLANWALRTSPKFITGVKYQFHQGFDQIRDPEIPITLPAQYSYNELHLIVTLKRWKWNQLQKLIDYVRSSFSYEAEKQEGI